MSQKESERQLRKKHATSTVGFPLQNTLRDTHTYTHTFAIKKEQQLKIQHKSKKEENNVNNSYYYDDIGMNRNEMKRFVSYGIIVMKRTKTEMCTALRERRFMTNIFHMQRPLKSHLKSKNLFFCILTCNLTHTSICIYMHIYNVYIQAQM